MLADESLTFGTLLRQYRMRAGLTQRALAERAAMGVESISAHERGVHPTPYRDTVARLASALGLSGADFDQLEALTRRASKPRSSKRTVKPGDGAPGELVEPPNNLQHRLATLVGREAMIADVRELCLAQRLVMLAGTGGVGKTRVALEVGAALLNCFPDGVWFVDLAPLGDGNLVPAALASALGLRDLAGRSIPEALISALRRRRVLLILDNCEHVLPAAVALVNALLESCTQVRILATSREPFGGAGEWVYEVLPLPYPPVGKVTAEDALHFGAIELFVKRAQAADRLFTLHDENAPLVAKICRRMDGLALGIELAATRVKALGLTDLARRLDASLHAVGAANRLTPARHQTLRALIDWSYELLTVPERTLLDRVSIFAGGWTIESAERVCAAPPLEAAQIVDLIAGLVDKSLIVAEREVTPSRYRLLESIREYATAKLADSGELPLCARRHAQFVADFAEHHAALRSTTPRRVFLRTIASEEDNARAALAWALGPQGSPALAARIAAAFSNYWFECGRNTEALRIVDSAFRLLGDDAADDLTEKLWSARSFCQTGTAAVQAAFRANALAAKLGDARRLARGFLRLAIGYRQMTQFSEAESAISRALELFREAGEQDTLFYASALGWRASALVGLGQYTEARALFEAGISLNEALGDDDCAAVERLNCAELEFAMGNAANSLALIEQALKVLRVVTSGPVSINERFVAGALLNAAACRLVLGELDAACTTAREALVLASRVQMPLYTAIALQHLATVGALGAQRILAARLLGFVDAVFARAGLEREPTEQRTYEILLREIRATVGDVELARLSAEGAQLSEHRAVGESLAISG